MAITAQVTCHSCGFKTPLLFYSEQLAWDLDEPRFLLILYIERVDPMLIQRVLDLSTS